MPYNDSATFYLGWLGDMRAIPTPEVEFNNTETRYGGTHVALNGAKTVDTIGVRQSYDFNFKYLTDADYQFFRALHTRLITEPVYLINPMRKNLLSQQSSSGYMLGVRDLGMAEWGNNLSFDYVTDFPPVTGGLVGTRAPRVVSVFGAPSYMTLDPDKNVPVKAGDTLTFSIWMKADGTVPNCAIYLDYYNQYGALTSSSSSTTISATTGWVRYSRTATVPAGITGARPIITFPTAGTYNLRMNAAQLEWGATPTPWQQGGGAQKVVVESFDVESPRYPLQNASLTLLEA